MSAKAMINAALNRAAAPMQRVAHPQGSAAQVQAIIAAEGGSAPLPVAPGHDDSVMIFRSLIDQGRGAAEGMQSSERVEALAAFDRMARVHPGVFAEVVRVGNLGYCSQASALSCLLSYSLTGAATLPHAI